MNRFVCKLILGFLLLAVMAVGAVSCGGGSTSSSSASGPATPSSVPIAIEGLDGVSGVDTSSSFQVTFPQDVRPDTVNSDTFFIVEYDGTSPNLSKFIKATYDPSNVDTSNKIEADISCEANVCTLTPRTPLSHGKTYVVVVTTAVQFTSGGYYDGYMATFTTTITIGGTVTGLVGSGLVLTNAWTGGSEDLTVSVVGAFEFTTAFSKDIVYTITVKTQPNSQICTVASGTGTTGMANITNVAVTCAASIYTVGVTVSGMKGTGLVLQNNGGDDLIITANGAFTFTTPVANGSSYAVTVSTNPTAETCTVTGGTGTISSADVTGIAIACSEAAWAKTVTSVSSASEFYGTAVDTSRNIYAVGYIYGNTENNFGNSVTATGAYSNGDNAVIVKYNWAGVAQWAKSVSVPIGMASASVFTAVTVDTSGNIYAVGYMALDSTYQFGVGVTAAGHNAVGNNAVIVKYNWDGAAQWADTTSDGASNSEFDGVSVDGSGNTYAVGYIQGGTNYNFGNGKVAQGQSASLNAVIVKYNSAGTTQWAKSTTVGVDWSRFYGVATDASGNSHAVGNIWATGDFDFGSGVINGGAGPENTVIVKYDTDGTALWAKTQTSAVASISIFYGVSVDTSGNSYAVGQIRNGTYDFQDGVTASGGYSTDNAVIVKYNSAGVAQWANSTSLAAAEKSYFYGASLDTSGNVYAVGHIFGTGNYNFGSGVINGTGYTNVVVVKYNSNGAAQSTYTAAGGSGNATSIFRAVSIDSSNNVYAVGQISEVEGFNGLTLDFGDGVTVTELNDGGDLIIVKYVP